MPDYTEFITRMLFKDSYWQNDCVSDWVNERMINTRENEWIFELGLIFIACIVFIICAVYVTKDMDFIDTHDVGKAICM